MDAATIGMYQTDGKAGLKALDDHLKGRSWIVGNAASIADVDAYGVCAYAPDGGFVLAEYPNIQAWMARVEALPGFGKPTAILPAASRAA